MQSDSTPKSKRSKRTRAMTKQERCEWWDDFMRDKVCSRCEKRPEQQRDLHWHHRDPATKRFDVGDRRWILNPETLLTEIEKCDLLCFDCHRAVHHEMGYGYWSGGNRGGRRGPGGTRVFGDLNGARTKPERLAHGERNGHAKLKADQVLEIRRRFASGESKAELSAAFGVTDSTIHKIVTRQRWASI